MIAKLGEDGSWRLLSLVLRLSCRWWQAAATSFKCNPCSITSIAFKSQLCAIICAPSTSQLRVFAAQTPRSLFPTFNFNRSTIQRPSQRQRAPRHGRSSAGSRGSSGGACSCAAASPAAATQTASACSISISVSSRSGGCIDAADGAAGAVACRASCSGQPAGRRLQPGAPRPQRLCPAGGLPCRHRCAYRCNAATQCIIAVQPACCLYYLH